MIDLILYNKDRSCQWKHLYDNIEITLNNNIILIEDYNNYLESICLATEEKLEKHTQEFYQEIEERIILKRRRIMYAGLGLIGSRALT